MQALQLSKQFFEEIAYPSLQAEFSGDIDKIAAGLVGNGSECFGYDDEYSKDHDWGIDFFLWVPKEEQHLIGPLAAWKEKLFSEHAGYPLRERSFYGAHIDVMTADDFYLQLIGFPQGPSTITEWRMVPEENLAMVVNGEVFCDPFGAFTATRKRMLEYYPEDLRCKKIAARCMAIAQTGQYNLCRCAGRGDIVTVRVILARFAEQVISMVFLLNKVFKPYYKWQYRRMTELPVLGKEVGSLLKRIFTIGGVNPTEIERQHELVEDICALLVKEMAHQDLSHADDWFLTAHGEAVQSGIKDPFLRSLPPQYE